MKDRRKFMGTVAIAGGLAAAGCWVGGSMETNGESIMVDLPLLRRLYELDREIENRFPIPRADKGLGQMGLLLAKSLKKWSYWCTPKNSLTFGDTGGEGVHFSFLLNTQRIVPTTPVIISVPDNLVGPQEANVVLADSLENFIRLGLIRGYFGMAGFSYNLEEALVNYASTSWEGKEEWAPSDGHQAVAEFVARELGLKPLSYTAVEFQALQARFKGLLQFDEA